MPSAAIAPAVSQLPPLQRRHITDLTALRALISTLPEATIFVPPEATAEHAAIEAAREAREERRRLKQQQQHRKLPVAKVGDAAAASEETPADGGEDDSLQVAVDSSDDFNADDSSEEDGVLSDAESADAPSASTATAAEYRSSARLLPPKPRVGPLLAALTSPAALANYASQYSDRLLTVVASAREVPSAATCLSFPSATAAAAAAASASASRESGGAGAGTSGGCIPAAAGPSSSSTVSASALSALRCLPAEPNFLGETGMAQHSEAMSVLTRAAAALYAQRFRTELAGTADGTIASPLPSGAFANNTLIGGGGANVRRTTTASAAASSAAANRQHQQALARLSALAAAAVPAASLDIAAPEEIADRIAAVVAEEYVPLARMMVGALSRLSGTAGDGFGASGSGTSNGNSASHHHQPGSPTGPSAASGASPMVVTISSNNSSFSTFPETLKSIRNAAVMSLGPKATVLLIQAVSPVPQQTAAQPSAGGGNNSNSTTNNTTSTSAKGGGNNSNAAKGSSSAAAAAAPNAAASSATSASSAAAQRATAQEMEAGFTRFFKDMWVAHGTAAAARLRRSADRRAARRLARNGSGSNTNANNSKSASKAGSKARAEAAAKLPPLVSPPADAERNNTNANSPHHHPAALLHALPPPIADLLSILQSVRAKFAQHDRTTAAARARAAAAALGEGGEGGSNEVDGASGGGGASGSSSGGGAAATSISSVSSLGCLLGDEEELPPAACESALRVAMADWLTASMAVPTVSPTSGAPAPPPPHSSSSSAATTRAVCEFLLAAAVPTTLTTEAMRSIVSPPSAAHSESPSVGDGSALPNDTNGARARLLRRILYGTAASAVENGANGEHHQQHGSDPLSEAFVTPSLLSMADMAYVSGVTAETPSLLLRCAWFLFLQHCFSPETFVPAAVMAEVMGVAEAHQLRCLRSQQRAEAIAAAEAEAAAAAAEAEEAEAETVSSGVAAAKKRRAESGTAFVIKEEGDDDAHPPPATPRHSGRLAHSSGTPMRTAGQKYGGGGGGRSGGGSPLLSSASASVGRPPLPPPPPLPTPAAMTPQVWEAIPMAPPSVHLAALFPQLHAFNSLATRAAVRSYFYLSMAMAGGGGSSSSKKSSASSSSSSLSCSPPAAHASVARLLAGPCLALLLASDDCERFLLANGATSPSESARLRAQFAAETAAGVGQQQHLKQEKTAAVKAEKDDAAAEGDGISSGGGLRYSGSAAHLAKAEAYTRVCTRDFLLRLVGQFEAAEGAAIFKEPVYPSTVMNHSGASLGPYSMVVRAPMSLAMLRLCITEGAEGGGGGIGMVFPKGDAASGGAVSGGAKLTSPTSAAGSPAGKARAAFPITTLGDLRKGLWLIAANCTVFNAPEGPFPEKSRQFVNHCCKIVDQAAAIMMSI